MAEPAEQNQVPQVHEVQVLQVQQPAPVAGQNVNPPAPPGATQEVTLMFLSFFPPVWCSVSSLSCHLFVLEEHTLGALTSKRYYGITEAFINSTVQRFLLIKQNKTSLHLT